MRQRQAGNVVVLSISNVWILYALQVTVWRCVATHKINTHLLLMLQKKPYKQPTQRFGGRFCHVLCVKISWWCSPTSVWLKYSVCTCCIKADVCLSICVKMWNPPWGHFICSVGEKASSQITKQWAGRVDLHLFCFAHTQKDRLHVVNC